MARKTELSCRPLRYREIARTVDVTERALRDTDPFFNYVFFPPPDAKYTRISKLGARFVLYIQYAYYVSQKEAITLDGGDGFITYDSAPNGLSLLRKIFQRMVQSIASVVIFLIITLAGTKEQHHRLKETRQQDEASKDTVNGGQLDDVFMIDTLAVTPDKQGLGYGSVLLEAVISQADAQSRRSYLYTRPQITPFYEKFGFVVVATYPVGENNPTWTRPPVQRVIMVREPTLKDAQGEEEQSK
ncbi:hypothetical protein SCP_0103160 [Sparassis crispa]|uniref:N-acetyltransferase domain-containing protein n=1 Tax=Sparassis crispa TaxID=139825 RepID=A0A401G5K0_9APHY|nr:hypothetical protein SCP_0103160 [Sparassis crispa]GBE77441.1 hypothetical protein SCP_0103160 [Sparassis crispa]